MNLLIRSAFVFSLVLMVTVTTSGRGTDKADDQAKARLLWEQAITAKGGRDQLHNVRSLVLSYEEIVRNFLGIVVHRLKCADLIWDQEAAAVAVIAAWLLDHWRVLGVVCRWRDQFRLTS